MICKNIGISPWIIVLMLGFLFSAAELFSKFKDEPFLILTYKTAWFYCVFNMIISGITFYLMQCTEFFGKPSADVFNAAFIAGLGSPVILRSKFLKININGKEAAIGPEIIINIFLETLEKQIDRSRAIVRKKLVEDIMLDIDFSKACNYAVTTMIASSQLDSPEAVKTIMEEAEKITSSPISDEEKSLALGYLLLDMMGEAFLKSLFHEKNRNKYMRSE